MHAQLQLCASALQLLDPSLALHLDKCNASHFFFLFRPLLVAFKREFSFEDILTLWERMWTDYQSSQFQIFIALAVLEKHRSIIMDHLRGFDEVLKYVNDLAGRIDVESTLVAAEALYKRMERRVEAVDRKDTLPAPGAGNGAKANGNAMEQAKKDVVVTPELRALLSNKPVSQD